MNSPLVTWIAVLAFVAVMTAGTVMIYYWFAHCFYC